MIPRKANLTILVGHRATAGSPFAWTLWISVIVACVLAGCDGKLKTYPVKGKVTFADGQPLKGGSIEFQSTLPGAEGLNARAAIQADGTFVLGTHTDDDGAISGEHQVAIVPPPYWETANPDAPEPVLHARYGRYATSGLTFKVEPGENFFPITVDRPE